MTDTVRTPLVPVSWGELVDKKTILEIKQDRLDRPEAIENARQELAALAAVLTAHGPYPEPLGELEAALRAVNLRLWDIEDAIRRKEAGHSFDAEFIALARSVYRTNDERARLKREINVLMRSGLVEEKHYAPY